MASTSSTALALRAELNRREAQQKREDAAQVAPESRPKRKSSWLTANKGVAERVARDDAFRRRTGVDVAHSKHNLERKAAIYEKLKKGKTAGLSSAQIDNLLVDFDGDDAAAQSDDSDSDSSDSDTFSPQREAMVEILDDFGRTRLVPRSEVPRDARIVGEHAPENDANVRYGDQTSFPVYMPDLEAIRKKFAESEQPLFARYDAKKDNRTRAAGQYIFSRDEETRQQELDDLKQMRDETQRARAGNNADDTLARAEDPLVRRRRQETEERRRRIQQKRAQVMAQNV